MELDFSFGIKAIGSRFRCNVFNQRGAVGAVYRLIPEKIRTFGDLGLPAVLANLAAPAELRYEVEHCHLVLEQQLGHPIRTFAYPFGKAEHVSRETHRAVRDARYSWAVTTRPGRNGPSSDPYLLRRNIADVSQHWLVLAADTAGVWSFLARLYHGARRLLRRRS